MTAPNRAVEAMRAAGLANTAAAVESSGAVFDALQVAQIEHEMRRIREQGQYRSGLLAARAVLYIVRPLLDALDKTIRDIAR